MIVDGEVQSYTVWRREGYYSQGRKVRDHLALYKHLKWNHKDWVRIYLANNQQEHLWKFTKKKFKKRLF